MYSKVNYTVIGGFVLLLVGSISFFAFWLGSRGYSQDYSSYILRIKESATGLSKDSGVKMKGVSIGTVRDIKINPDNIEEVDIILNIKRDTPIKSDMRGVIKMYGLTGLSYVEIEGGSNESPLLEGKDGKMPIIKSSNSLGVRLENRLEVLSAGLVSVLDRAEKLLTDENIKNFGLLVESSNQFFVKGVDVEERAIVTLDETEQTLKDIRNSLKQVTNDFDTITTDFHENIAPTLKQLESMTKSISSVSQKIENSIKRGDYNLKKILKPMMVDIRQLSTQVEEMSAEIEQSPSDLLLKSNKKRRGPGE